MPFVPQQWTRIEFRDTPIYVCPEKPHWFVPNRAGDKILQRLADGAELTGDREAARFLDRLPAGCEPHYTGRAGHLATDHLRELWLHITDRCNMTCRHCLFASGPDRRAELPVERVLALADEAAELGCRVFALTGGEPFVHPRFEQILDGLLAHDGANVAVLTNGTMLRANARTLGDWCARGLHLQVSLDGLAQTHDAIRGEGAFAALGEQLAWLKGQAIPFTLSMCVTRQNVAQMPDLVRYAAAAGAGNVHFMWFFIRGRGEAGQFAPIEQITTYFRDAALAAERLGVSLDNIEALKTQIFAPPGTIHDGAGGGWEALAVGPDGNVYPSAATLGEAALATPMNGDLASAWRGSSVLDQVRNATAAETDSPLRYLIGGGDPDHSFLHAGTLLGGDPYQPVYEQTALWLIAREAEAQSEDGPPALRLKMGDVLESCGAHGSVALVHNNCLLSLADVDGRSAVKSFYAAAAEVERADIYNPIAYDEGLIAHIPPEFRFRGYGCGSPVSDANLTPGDVVVDLGSGAGVECFVAAKLVGRSGYVYGVDMTDPMLDRANRALDGVAEALGFRNVEFRKGYLEQLPLAAGSADVVISNCVLNLSTHKRRMFAEILRVLKPGGRLVVSDVVSETEPSAAIRNDDVLRGECIAGAMTQGDLFAMLAESGFVATRAIRRFPYRVVREHPFFSLTFESHVPAPAARVRVMYRGPFESITTHAGTVLRAGIVSELTRDEIRGCGEQLFEFAADGSVANADIGEAAGCGCVSVLDAAGASCCSTPPEPGGTACLPSRVSTDEARVHEQPGPPTTAERHTSGCMVCGKPLTYPDAEVEAVCSYCRETFGANAVCVDGHFVCDACHAADALGVIERVCLATDETDMIALLGRIRSHVAVPVHGPEHHALVPGIILATYRNLGGAVSETQLRTAIRRGATVAGGSCGFLGACGAAVGVGVAFSILLEANPLKPAERRFVQTVVQQVLESISSLEAARCCQRECVLALRKAAEISPKYLPIVLRADAPIACVQMHRNTECLGRECPLWPKSEGDVT